MIRTTGNLDLLNKKPAYYVNISDIFSAIFKEVLRVRQKMMLKVFIIRPKNHGSLTLQTKFKVELNMGDLACPFGDSVYP